MKEIAKKIPEATGIAPSPKPTTTSSEKTVVPEKGDRAKEMKPDASAETVNLLGI